MKDRGQFEAFLHCCRTQRIRRMHFADVWMLANPASGDFGNVVIEFEETIYLITSKKLHDADRETFDEFCVQKIGGFAEIEDQIKKEDIYMTLSGEDGGIHFLTEMVDEDEAFNGLEFRIKGRFLFLTAGERCLVILASNNETLKYEEYPHQFGEGVRVYPDHYVNFFT